jgi:hypothetical protein
VNLDKAIEILNKFGFPTFVVCVFFLLYTGTFASPVTETSALLKAHVVATDNLNTEVKKVVRLLGVMCLSNAKNPESCIDAVTTTETTVVLKGAMPK